MFGNDLESKCQLKSSFEYNLEIFVSILDTGPSAEGDRNTEEIYSIESKTKEEIILKSFTMMILYF